MYSTFIHLFIGYNLFLSSVIHSFSLHLILDLLLFGSPVFDPVLDVYVSACPIIINHRHTLVAFGHSTTTHKNLGSGVLWKIIVTQH